MKLFTYVASVLLSPAVGAQSEFAVRTSSGTYTGFINSTTPHVNQWLGIPYGQPPIGSLRFRPPLKAPDYGATEAKSYKPICIQDSGDKTGVFWEAVPEFQNTDPQSEDCLYLNIWAPRKPVEEKVPVIIWVCGGAFREGGGHAPYQVPDHWIQRTQTHIVVTFNYRLNVFGFPGLPVGNRNAGLMDIRLVVEWLRDNIQGFGGDPERMVLYGQSAGSGAVLAYGYANAEDPIVSGLIASSSGAGDAYSANSTLFHDLAQSANCANLTQTKELECMQNVDARELQRLVLKINPDPTRALFTPLADNFTLFENMTDRLVRGLVAKVPLITGLTYNEGMAFSTFHADDTSPPSEPVPEIGSMLACGAIREAKIRAQYGLRSYSYLYSGNFTNITPRYWLGGMHSSDIPLVFGTHNLFRGNSTNLEWQTSFAMEAFWVSFASNSSVDPRNHLGQTWPRYTVDNPEIIVFGNATMPSASTVADVSLAEQYAGPC